MNKQTYEVPGIVSEVSVAVSAAVFAAYWLGVYRADAARYDRLVRGSQYDLERVEYGALRDKLHRLAEEILIELKAALAAESERVK